MPSYCRKNTENINPVALETKNGRTMISSRSAICGAKKSKFIKNLKNLPEAKELLSNPGIRTPLSKNPVLGDVFF